MKIRNEEVAQRAYELYLARGAEHGSDLNDWLEAERQLLGNGAPRRRTQRLVAEPRSPKMVARKKVR